MQIAIVAQALASIDRVGRPSPAPHINDRLSELVADRDDRCQERTLLWSFYAADGCTSGPWLMPMSWRLEAGGHEVRLERIACCRWSKLWTG